MKTKIKTKNEFQNPNLIFGNEIQKRKLKLKNEIRIENQKRKSNLKRMIDEEKDYLQFTL